MLSGELRSLLSRKFCGLLHCELRGLLGGELRSLLGSEFRMPRLFFRDRFIGGTARNLCLFGLGLAQRVLPLFFNGRQCLLA